MQEQMGLKLALHLGMFVLQQWLLVNLAMSSDGKLMGLNTAVSDRSALCILVACVFLVIRYEAANRMKSGPILFYFYEVINSHNFILN